MATRKTKVRKIIDDYVAGKNTKPFALGSGLVFISPANVKTRAIYYLHVRVTPPKGKPFWVGSCNAFRFNEKDTCKHIEAFETQINDALEDIIEKEDKERKSMARTIKKGRKARTKK